MDDPNKIIEQEGLAAVPDAEKSDEPETNPDHGLTHIRPDEIPKTPDEVIKQENLAADKDKSE